jgi:hypothetical protein
MASLCLRAVASLLYGFSPAVGVLTPHFSILAALFHVFMHLPTHSGCNSLL